MTKFILAFTAATAMASVLGPVAAQADVGTSMYQPGPIIVHAQTPKVTPGSTGRAAYRYQMSQIQAKETAG